MARVQDLIELQEAVALGVSAGLPEDLFEDVAARGLVDVFLRDGRALVRRSEIEAWCRVHGRRRRPVELRPAS